MMKRFLFAAIMLAATIPAAINLQAQDDDIYFSKKADKKAKHEAIYATTAADEWSTNANSDWDLDDYNRRSKEDASTLVSDVLGVGDEVPFYYNVIDEKGDTVLVPGNKKMLKNADISGYKVVRDTVVLVEQYRFTDLICRFHNPFFAYYRYSPWYDVAYYDPFYWDYCYYDPWWYVTPSFGFRWGSWYGGWSYGYYSGWYGGWYSPFYCPNPHYYHYCYNDYYNGPVYNYATGSSHRGSSRNNFGGHFAHRGGWKGDGGSVSRMASASTNRSYRAANGARVGFTNSNGTYSAGPTLRGRNTVNGRLANSNMRSNSSEYNRSATSLGVSRGGDATAPVSNGSYSSRRHTATRYNGEGGGSASQYTRGSSSSATSHADNSSTGNTRSRRGTIVSSNRGFSYDNSSSRRAANTYTPSRSSGSYDHSSSSYSRGSYNSGSSSYNSGSSYSSGSNTRSSSSYSSGSSSSYSGGGGGGGSYSRGGGGGGSHSSSSSHGRR